MATIIITSKLTENQQARLRRSAEKQDDQVADPAAFVHVRRNKYARLHDDVNNPFTPHDVARRMMVIAGTTFDYEIR